MSKTATTSKLTKKDNYNVIAEYFKANPELTFSVVKGDNTFEVTAAAIVDFCDHELELLERKNTSTGERKLTETQQENIKLRQAIVDFMKPNTYYTVTQLMTEVPEVKAVPGISNQRVSALCNALYATGQLEKTMDKRKALFSLAK